MNNYTYALGATLMTIGISAPVLIDPQALKANGIRMSIRSVGTSGALYISPSSGATIGQGYLVSATEQIDIQGPAKFYMLAALNDVTVNTIFKLSAGAELE